MERPLPRPAPPAPAVYNALCREVALVQLNNIVHSHYLARLKVARKKSLTRGFIGVSCTHSPAIMR